MKTVKFSLVGIDGNAFSIMGAFSEQARKEGWGKEETQVVLDEAMEGDYNHLIATIWGHCEEPEQDDDKCTGCKGKGEVFDSVDEQWYECWQCDGLG